MGSDSEQSQLERNTERFVDMMNEDFRGSIHPSIVKGRRLFVVLIPDARGDYGTMVVTLEGTPPRGRILIDCNGMFNSDQVFLHRYWNPIWKDNRFKIFRSEGLTFSISLKHLAKDSTVKLCIAEKVLFPR
jgi:hypothetical protein